MIKQLGEWKHFRKTAPIMAILVATAVSLKLIGEGRVVKTLETPEGVVMADDQWLCKATTGEFWPQEDERLRKTYDLGDIAPDGFTLCIPKPDAEGVLAARVTRPEFQVQSGWGLLSGVAGDYYVHSLTDPADAWIVKGALFESTYREVV